MSELRKRTRDGTDGKSDHNNGQGQGIWVDKGMHRLAPLFHTGHSLRIVRHGKRTIQVKDDVHDHARMSKLWKSVLGLLQEIGDRSGCHQLPERSFRIRSYTFPVCARCTGVFLGQVSAVVACVFGLSVSPLPSLFLLSVMGIDWSIQRVGWVESTNLRRLISGLCGGFGLFSLYLFGLAQIWRSY